MPIELVALAKSVSDDNFESSVPGRLSSFGFSGTIAHGAFAPEVFFSLPEYLNAQGTLVSQYRSQQPSTNTRAMSRTSPALPVLDRLRAVLLEPSVRFHVERVCPGQAQAYFTGGILTHQGQYL